MRPLARRRGLRAPDEDDRGRWLARFPIVNANEVKPYAMAAVFFTLGGGDAPEDRPAVQLSHHRPYEALRALGPPG